MTNHESESELEVQTARLRTGRDKLLAFHKLLIDLEKRDLERTSGTVTPGQFLSLLLNDERFEWLRTISRLVVRIDEAFEVDDGIHPDMVGNFETEILLMFDDSDANPGFKDEVYLRMPRSPEADAIRNELKSIFE